MKNRVLSLAPEVAGALIRDIAAWDVLIGSGLVLSEERATWCGLTVSVATRIFLCRPGGMDLHRFKLRCETNEKGGSTKELSWNELQDFLAEHIPAGANVLVDLNLLPLDCVLYLLPALRNLGLACLGCVYVAPSDYSFPDRPLSDQILHRIEQPRGYAALALDADRQDARHLVFLGFDQARAWKFIERYDWKFEHLYVVLGDPPFVPQGVERARKAAQPWLEDFERGYPTQVQYVPATDPDAVAWFCLKHFRQARWLDLAPLGPKPVNLGILWFYFSLTPAEQGRVRFLYDFPVQSNPRSTGIARVHYFDCTHLLAP